MLVIIADRRDAEAAALVQRWRDHDAEMLSIGDLSAPGWCHRVASPGALTAVVNGRVVPTEEITGVLTLLPAVTAPRLGRILPEDRHYVASEMTAFLAAWLSELACPVVNRPGTVCLMGPNWQLGQWIHAAARLGIPVCPQHRRIAMNGGGRPAQAEGPPTTITVAGQHCVGDADAVLSGHARRLADAAGVTLLAVHFDGPTEGARLLGAGLRPRVASPEIADAILGHLLGERKVLILLWGVGSDGPMRMVRDALQRLGAPTHFFDQRNVLEAELELYIGGEVGGAIREGGEAIDLGEVTACYLRPYDGTDLPEVARAGPDSPAWRHATEVQDALCCWTEVTPALVVNRLAAMAANGSKPYQLARIREFGFRVPETLVTTEPAAVRSFWERHGDVIYKSISAIRSRVSRLSETHLGRLNDIGSCPTQFQQYIPGTDYRVHVVGSEVFSCSVQSEVDDYRYPGGGDVAIDACRLPTVVEDQCRRLAAAMGLHVAGIDLRCNRVDGEWYCFEVNPSPGFNYYEEATGLPIAAALARLLAAGTARRRTTIECEARNAVRS